MFGRKIHLFKLLGFNINIDPSWFFLVILVTWSLSGTFHSFYPQLPQAVTLLMGVAGALGLFGSIVLHELSHAVVARRNGIVMNGITLFIFGGVAEMTSEPPNAKVEFQVAIAGPLASVLVGLVCLALAYVGSSLGAPDAIVGVLFYLAVINAVLIVFNIIPAFPLDGGRVLRAALWARSGDLTGATRTASRIGVGFAVVLMVWGVWRIIKGDWSGMWSIMIGMFLRNAARASLRNVLVQSTFAGQSVDGFMQHHPISIPADTTVDRVMSDYVARYHFKMFPVVDGERLVGAISALDLKQVPEGKWSTTTSAHVAAPATSLNTIAAGSDAMAALTMMQRYRVTRLMVVNGSRLVGILTAKDLVKFLSVRDRLGGGNGRR